MEDKDKGKQKFWSLNHKTIQALKTNRNWFLVTEGQKNRNAFKQGLEWAISSMEDREELLSKELAEWFEILMEYQKGKRWDTGGHWVCENHPLMPFEQGYEFDCQCGGPGMPPGGADG